MRAAGAEAARSLDDPILPQPFLRVGAGALLDPHEPTGSAEGALLLDTTPDRLLDRLAFPDLARFAARVAERGVGLALRGRLEAPDVPRLLPLGPSVLVFDAPPRDVAGRIDADALAELTALFKPPKRADPFEGVPDRVFVRDLVEEMELGAYAAERGRRQRVRFSVEAELAPHTGPRTGANVYSYDRIIDAVRALARRTPEPFVETLAEMLAEELLVDDRLLAVAVRVEKLDLGPSSAGVEIRRTRAWRG